MLVQLCRWVIFLLACSCTGASIAAQEWTYPPQLTLEDVRQRIDGVEANHPRLLVGPGELAELRESLRDRPLARALADQIVRQAESLLDQPPVERRLEGRRLLGQSRLAVQRVLTLAMAFHLSGRSEFAARADKEMLAAAAFSDWNPTHFLDVGEMAFALAIGYDWLYHELPSASRDAIAEALINKALKLPFETVHRGWVRARNNWGQVCHGGLTAAALAILETEPELAAKTVHHALQHVVHSMEAYAPAGSYPEGPGYWVYGTSYNVLLIAALESVLGSDFGLSQAPGFDGTGSFPALMTGPSGEYFNYADGGAGRGLDPTLYWFARRFQRPDWLWGEEQRLRGTIEHIEGDPRAGQNRMLPLLLLWIDEPQPTGEPRLPLHWNGLGQVPVTVHRSSWTEPPATFVGLKGGSPSANHGQMDIGSFVLDADGVRWALDLGAEGYHAIEARGMSLWSREQESDRWKIFRQSNAGHNTLVIDGQLQRAAGNGTFVTFSDHPQFPHSILDLSDVYRLQADRVRRGVGLFPTGEVLFRDELDGLKPESSVRWGMITRGEPAIEAAGRVTLLSQGSSTLRLEIVAPHDAVWTVVDTSAPRNEWDSPNPGTRMLALECAATSPALAIAVRATPGSCPQPVKAELDRPLDQWDD